MTTRASGLGRGLSSLIPGRKITDIASSAMMADGEVAEFLNSNEKIWELPINRITPNPHQPRQQFKEAELADLGESIKEHGIIQPLIVSKEGNDWQLIAGERRLRAGKLIGLKTVPAIVRGLTEQKKMEIALIENLQRENLNPLETAAAYRKLLDEFNLDLGGVAKKVGKSISAVSNFMRLLNLHDEVKEAIWQGRLTEGHARTLAGLPLEDQVDGMKNILENKMTVREAEKAAKEVVIKKKIRNLSHDPEIREMENQLASVLGTKVEIRRHGGVGQITIKFFSNGELVEIFRKIS